MFRPALEGSHSNTKANPGACVPYVFVCVCMNVLHVCVCVCVCVWVCVCESETVCVCVCVVMSWTGKLIVVEQQMKHGVMRDGSQHLQCCSQAQRGKDRP